MNYRELPYNQLQKLAKQRGIKANSKTMELITALENYELDQINVNKVTEDNVIVNDLTLDDLSDIDSLFGSDNSDTPANIVKEVTVTEVTKLELTNKPITRLTSCATTAINSCMVWLNNAHIDADNTQIKLLAYNYIQDAVKYFQANEPSRLLISDIPTLYDVNSIEISMEQKFEYIYGTKNGSKFVRIHNGKERQELKDDTKQVSPPRWYRRLLSKASKNREMNRKKTEFAINAQQIPRSNEFRSCFKAQAGYKLVICDFSQIELRLGAELIKIPQMIEAFKNEQDLHTVTASLIYKIPVAEVQKHQRQEGKTLNFALLYGMGYRKYKTYAAQSGKVISLSDAKVAHTAFHTAYPRLREWHRERSAMVADGWCYVRTPLGRRRLLSYDDALMTACANTLIQGAGADILKLSLAELGKYLDEEASLVACVHDEIVLEVIESKANQFKEILEKSMTLAAETILKVVPAKADASIADTWAEK